MIRRSLLLVALGLALDACSMAKHGQTNTDPTKITCEEFLAMSDTVQPRAIAWLDGYDHGKLKEEDVGEVAVDRQTAVLVAACKEEPKKTLWEKIRGHFPGGSKKVKPTKMTCAEYSALSESEKPEVAYWLEGYDKAKGINQGVGAQVDLERDVAVVVELCKPAPQESLWSKIKGKF
jgi:acid stress chaperone HdeA